MQTTQPPAATPIVGDPWHFKDHSPQDPAVEDWTRPGWQDSAAWIFGSLAVLLLFLQFVFMLVHVSRPPQPEAQASVQVSH